MPKRIARVMSPDVRLCFDEFDERPTCGVVVIVRRPVQVVAALDVCARPAARCRNEFFVAIIIAASTSSSASRRARKSIDLRCRISIGSPISRAATAARLL